MLFPQCIQCLVLVYFSLHSSIFKLQLQARAMILLACHICLSLLDGAMELLDLLIFASLEPVLQLLKS